MAETSTAPALHSAPAVRRAVPRCCIAAVLLLAACGGGGGGSGSPSPSSLPGSSPPTAARPDPPAPQCINTADAGCLAPEDWQDQRKDRAAAHAGAAAFSNQWGLAAIGADRAWAQLELQHGAGAAPGQGVTVGLIDSGIDTAHPVFAGKWVSETFLDGAADERGDGDHASHGTAVASVIAARPDAAFTAEVTAARGVAWGADLAMFAIPTGQAGDHYDPLSPSGFGDVDERWAARVARILDWSKDGRRLDFVNVSVGFPGIVEQYSEAELRRHFGETIAALAQRERTDRTVFVWAAGNAHGKDCDAADFANNPGLCRDGKVNARSVELLAGLPARIAELRGHHVAAVAIAEDGEIASFSNRCGIAASWCLAAPGASVRAAYFGPDNGRQGARGAYTTSGTSFAAPMVTGGLTVMKHAFRDQLSNTELVQRLFATANREGVYADRGTYGQGLMNLGAATAPVGTVAVAHSAQADGPGAPVAETGLALGGAFGDGLAHGLAGMEIAAFDTLGAPFWYALDSFAVPAPSLSAAARLEAFMAPTAGRHTGLLQPRFMALAGKGAGPALLSMGQMELTSGHLALAGRALAARLAPAGGPVVNAFSTEGRQDPAPVSGAALSWRLPDTPLMLGGGLAVERQSLLGSRAGGAFGQLSGATAFAGIEGYAQLGPWRAHAAAELGSAAPDAEGGMIASMTALTTSAFALRAERQLADGEMLSIRLAQPLRVEAGRARLAVPAGRRKDGTVLRRTIDASLEPSGRQIDLQAAWSRTLYKGGELRIGARLSRHLGHNRAAQPEHAIIASVQLPL